ncbi:NAD(P)-binding Rossmann-fold superfamily protein [Zea mays]|uniref:NAD(P)-binding Rossmann-fold superfamily protein n=1 Tax=Zea mays TaxID=4577 RepID=A0A1D6FSL9_MAIZE|nr:NAD(P)-binding Rossmann-fold superfamily protein [Zea mays]
MMARRKRKDGGGGWWAKVVINFPHSVNLCSGGFTSHAALFASYNVHLLTALVLQRGSLSLSAVIGEMQSGSKNILVISDSSGSKMGKERAFCAEGDLAALVRSGFTNASTGRTVSYNEGTWCSTDHSSTYSPDCILWIPGYKNITAYFGCYTLAHAASERGAKQTSLFRARTLKEYQPEILLFIFVGYAGGFFLEHSFFVDDVINVRYYRNITANTLAVLEAMAAHNVRTLIYSSTCATYGEPDKMPIAEGTPMFPINPYGKAKKMAEDVILDFSKSKKLDMMAVMILRYFNVIGSDLKGRLGEAPRHELRKHGCISGACFDATLGIIPGLKSLRVAWVWQKAHRL